MDERTFDPEGDVPEGIVASVREALALVMGSDVVPPSVTEQTEEQFVASNPQTAASRDRVKRARDAYEASRAWPS